MDLKGEKTFHPHKQPECNKARDVKGTSLVRPAGSCFATPFSQSVGETSAIMIAPRIKAAIEQDRDSSPDFIIG
jgi:hypothetical protein